MPALSPAIQTRSPTVIFALSRQDDLPEQLVLGSDTMARIAQNDAVRSAAALYWDKVSRSTDFGADRKKE